MGMTGDITRYLNRQKTLGRSGKTILGYRWRLLSLKESFPGKNARDITTRDLQALQDHLLTSGKSPGTRRAVIATVKHFFAWMFASGKLLSNPAARIELEKKRQGRIEMPPDENEVSDILESVQPETYSHTLRRAILEILYGCGLRRAEVAAIKLEQIDFGKNLLLVRGKGDKERIVPIPDGTMHFINVYLAIRPVHGERLFLKESGVPINPTFIDNLFGWLRRRTQTTIHAHLLRHAFAVHLLRNGADIRVLQELLGHESIDDTARYLRLVKNDVKQAYHEAMEDLI